MARRSATVALTGTMTVSAPILRVTQFESFSKIRVSIMPVDRYLADSLPGSGSVRKPFRIRFGIVYNVDAMTKREEELLAEGWERRFVATDPRLGEAVELYGEIGFDVLLEPLPTEQELKGAGCEESGCTVCFDIDRERYRVIYTRAREARKT